MLEPQLDHPSCHPVKGWFLATGEWTPENNPDVLIYLKSYGVAKGPEIVWEYEISSVELYEGDHCYAFADEEPNASYVGAFLSFIDMPEKSRLWMLAVAYCWAKRDAADWANCHKEPIAE